MPTSILVEADSVSAEYVAAFAIINLGIILFCPDIEQLPSIDFTPMISEPIDLAILTACSFAFLDASANNLLHSVS